MHVKIKKLKPNSVVPKYSKLGDAGLDLTATSMEIDEFGNISYGTGLAFEIPVGYVGLLFPRSSNSKTDLMLTNHCGILDSGYRGEVMFKFSKSGKYRHNYKGQGIRCFENTYIDTNEYKIGDRIGQLIIIPYPEIELIESDDLSETERGSDGYGSSGR